MKKVKQQPQAPEQQDDKSLTATKREQSVLKSTRLLDHESFLKEFKSSKTPDAELIHDYNTNHNQQAFEKLYKRHKSPMLAYLYGILHNWEDAKDVLHNSWEVVLLSFTKGIYDEQQDFAGWFKGICYRKASEWKRESRRFIYGSEHLPDRVDHAFNADQIMENRQSEILLQFAINKLPESERQIVILRAYKKMSFAEIAVIRHITITCARGMYCKAVIKLKKAIS